MKARKSFIRKNTIAVIILIITLVVTGIKTISVEMMYRELQAEEEEYLIKIKELEETLEEKKKDLSEVDSLDFVEKYARETLKMVKPNEVYFIINYPKDDE